MNIKSVILLRSVIRHLVQAMEILNQIPEDNYREAVLKARSKKHHIKHICENGERGGIFLIVFWLREMLEEIVNEPL